MRYIKVPSLIENVSGQTVIKTVIATAGPQGMNVGQMRMAMKILDKVDNLHADGVIELQDEEYNYLKQRFNTFPFGIVNPAIIDLADRIEAAPTSRSALEQ